MTTDEYIQLGRAVAEDGRLRALRRRLGFSGTYMAELLSTNPLTYKSWENPSGVRLWKSTAERVGRLYHSARTTLDELDIDIRDYTPLHAVAPRLGLPQEELLRRYREGDVHAIDLGILGLWVEKTEVRRISRG